MASEARTCQTCGRMIPAFTTAFTLRIQLFAEAGQIDITPDDLAVDHEQKLKELYKEMENADPQELMDEVGDLQEQLAQANDRIEQLEDEANASV